MGIALEEALTQVLRIRLALAIETGSETLTLQRLCGLKLWKGYSGVAIKALKSPLQMQIPLDDTQEVIKVSACSRDSEGVEFLAELDAIEVSADFPIRILRSAPNDSWDVCVKAYNPSTGRPFHVFFDCKSGAEFVPGRNNDRIENDLIKREQYNLTTTVLGSARDHLYIYCITHEGVPEDTLSLNTDKSDVGGAIMGRDGTFKLLGPFAELYRVARSSSAKECAGNV